ncbi:MAG: hypothetical protein DRN12_07030 [Thermoplasmata archaeon]|nr:MAG: hypothetical protein DRN12_07030 [Thermoplasmata archaeon]
MKKTRRPKRFSVRTASKSVEKKLLQNAEKLYEDPFIVLPKFEDNVSKKAFSGIIRQIKKIDSIKDNVDKLERFSKKKSLAGAVAGTLLIAHSKKAPFLAVVRLPTGEVTYAQRGKADKKFLVAVQHLDDPSLRLLGVRDIALKRKLHIYSWNNSFVSKGDKPSPPKEFIDFIIDKLSLNLNGDVASCKHIPMEKARDKQEVENRPYLRIQWNSANVIIALCKSCTKNSGNTLFSITRYLIEPDISSDFNIEVIGHIIKDRGEVETFFVDKYLSGALSDYQLIVSNMEKRRENLRKKHEVEFILDGKSYGDDIDGFINALNPKPYERYALSWILEKIDHPVVVSNITPNGLLEQFWEEYGLDVLSSLVDEDLANDLVSLDDTPSGILKTAWEYKERQEISSKLPRYKNLPTIAAFADHIARTYHIFGLEKTLSEIRNTPSDTKGKSISYAFLLALGRAGDQKWRYSNIEIEMGEFLEEYARRLLEATPEEYHNALKELLSASGVSENIDDLLQ